MPTTIKTTHGDLTFKSTQIGGWLKHKCGDLTLPNGETVDLSLKRIFSNSTPSPNRDDRAIDALRDAGIEILRADGTPHPNTATALWEAI